VRSRAACKGSRRPGPLRGLPSPHEARRQGTAVGDVMALLALRASLLAAPRLAQGWAPKWNARADPCGAPDCGRGQCAWEGVTCGCAAHGAPFPSRAGPLWGARYIRARDGLCAVPTVARPVRLEGVACGCGAHGAVVQYQGAARATAAPHARQHAVCLVERLDVCVLSCHGRLGLGPQTNVMSGLGGWRRRWRVTALQLDPAGSPPQRIGGLTPAIGLLTAAQALELPGLG